MSKKYFRLLLIVYIIAILAVASIPGKSMPKVEIWSIDKIFHFIEYFILAFLAINSFLNSKFKILIIILAGIIYGGFIELWQEYVVGRDASIYDEIANSLGMIIGSIITVGYLKFTND